MPRRKTPTLPKVSKVKPNIIELEDDSDFFQKKKNIISPKTLDNIRLTEKQVELIKLIDENDVIIIKGSGGTSKTFLSCYYTLSCLKSHRYEKIIFTKPVQESGENLGFLPGSIDEKISPHYESYKNTLLKFIDSKTLDRLYENDVITNKPLAFMRGADWENHLMILDEAQNADIRSLILFITRMGKGSKIIICGDISQHDINKENVALDYLGKLIGNVPGVAVFEFTEDDIMRHSILIEITKRYEMAKNNNELPKMKRY